MNDNPANNEGVEAPVADWVTIPELYDDPFAIFERLRAEGGVHWVPAANRYLVTSYAAVHETELDQTIYSANEEGSLMIRAMGHSMLRKDDPEHYVERRAWQPVLRPGVVKKAWMPVFERNAERYLQEFLDKGPGADLIWDFAGPYVAENLRAIIGLHNATQEDLQRWSQHMIDATGNYGDDPKTWELGEIAYNEVDEALDEMLAWHADNPDDSLISALLRLPDYQMPLESIRANVKMTIGGGVNEPRDAIGVSTYALITNPEQRRLATQGEGLWDSVFDEAIRWVAPIGLYSRQTTQDVVLEGVRLPAGAKLGISLLSANRDENLWKSPEKFDITRTGEGAHLAFGKGVHVCLGAWVARAEVATIALPKLFRHLPDIELDPNNPSEMAGWVFRGMTKMPVTWTPERETSTADAPRVAIIGGGPSGCYTAQALRREFPDAELSIIDQLPVPYGLVRHGVAADHQGTKAVSKQFARLFEQDSVRFIGNTRIGDEIDLDDLRANFDAVVLATGLHADAELSVPGADLEGVHGAGRITRLLNAHPLEPRPAPNLGTSLAVVGHGNVAMDIVRLVAKRPEDLLDSDLDDESHRLLASNVKVMHAIGRSLPSAAKFDPVMLREIADLDGVDHVIHGVDKDALAQADDPRSELVRDLMTRPSGNGRVRVEWWFGYEPKKIEGAAGNVSSIEIAPVGADSGASTRLEVDSVVTAIGFAADSGQRIAAVGEEARETGRIEPGLYVAGWARRGPRGTIPSQRTDSRELAKLIAADFTAPSTKPGLHAVEPLFSEPTTYDGWLLIDAHEASAAAAGRVRRKIVDLDELRRIASAASELIATVAPPKEEGPLGDPSAEPISILFATESGNGELVAEELAGHLARNYRVTVTDLESADASVLDTGTFTVVICSTYGDGELPATAKDFHAQLLSERPDLSGLRYAVFGLGDRSYTETYSRGSEILDEALQSLGGQRVGEYGRHDAAGRELAPAVALEWIDRVLSEVTVK